MKKIITYISSIFFTAIIISACSGDGSNENSGVDELTIGSQVWMNKNLDADKFRNGDPIPQAKTLEEWEEFSNKKAGPIRASFVLLHVLNCSSPLKRDCTNTRYTF